MNDKKLDLILSKLEKIDKLEADMEGMKSNIVGLKTDMHDMITDVKSVKTGMQGMKTDVQGMKTGMQGMKTDVQGMKTGMQGIKIDMQSMKTTIQGMKSEAAGVKQRVDSLEGTVRDIRLHLENSTDRNIQLLAENFIELTNKLNQAIPAADKNYAYEVKVNYLIEEVQEIKKRMEAEGFATA